MPPQADEKGQYQQSYHVDSMYPSHAMIKMAL